MLNENILLHFFQEHIDLQELQDALDEEFYRDEDDDEEEETNYHYTFNDMDEVHTIEPTDLVVFCEATLEGDMRAEGLSLIAKSLLHAEKITWDDDLISDICNYWLEPNEDYPLDDSQALLTFKKWLTGEESIPVVRA